MNLAYLVPLLFIATSFSGCKKIIVPELFTLQGNWDYSGYSGGIGGIRFTSVNSDGPYFQIDGSNFLITDDNGIQKCMLFSFQKNSSRNNDFPQGLIILSDTSVLLPESDETRYYLFSNEQGFSLYPFGWGDAYETYYSKSIRTFTPCK
jgi:hypothetical protein